MLYNPGWKLSNSGAEDSMRQHYDRTRNYCGRTVRMRKMPDGGWLPFEGGRQHFCVVKWLITNAPYAAGAIVMVLLFAAAFAAY
jgi:hypothetical protein